MTKYLPITIVSPAQFDRGTAQTPGSQREAALAPALGVETSLWGDILMVEPGARTGIHHHGEQKTIAYGERGEFFARAKAGDFVHVPRLLPHMEANVSRDKPFRWVVVRSTATPIVINLPDNYWR